MELVNKKAPLRSVVYVIATPGGSTTGVIVGVTVLLLCLVVCVVCVTGGGGGSYRRSRRRRLIRTAPAVTVQSPPVVSTSLTTPTIQTPVVINTTSYPQAQSGFKDYPPPYSTIAATTTDEVYSGTSEQGTLWGEWSCPCREVVPISEGPLSEVPLY